MDANDTVIIDDDVAAIITRAHNIQNNGDQYGDLHIALSVLEPIHKTTAGDKMHYYTCIQILSVMGRYLPEYTGCAYTSVDKLIHVVDGMQLTEQHTMSDVVQRIHDKAHNAEYREMVRGLPNADAIRFGMYM